MSESKILQSLLEFKTKYAWDKSLTTPNETSTSRPPLITPGCYENSNAGDVTYEKVLEAFTKGK